MTFQGWKGQMYSNTLNTVKFGTVWFGNPFDGYGFVTPDGWKERAHIADPCRPQFLFEQGRHIIAGVSHPEFAGVLENPNPRGGEQADRLVYQLDESVYSAEIIRRWGFQTEYDAALAEIAARPVYRITQLTYYKGRLVQDGQRSTYEGTLRELAGRTSPKDFPSKIIDLVYNYPIEEMKGGTWQNCDDKQVRGALRIPAIQPVDGVKRLSQVDATWAVHRINPKNLVMAR